MTTEASARANSVSDQFCIALDATQLRLLTFGQVCGKGVSFAEETLLNPHPRVRSNYQELVRARLTHARSPMSSAPVIVRVFPRAPTVVAANSAASSSGSPRSTAAVAAPPPLLFGGATTGSPVHLPPRPPGT